MIAQILMRCVQQSGMPGRVISLGGHHYTMRVMVNRVMSVYILMRDLSIERVFARGFDEDDVTDPGGEIELVRKKNSTFLALDLYTESSYEAIRLVSTHAMAAVLFFTHRSGQEDHSLRLLLIWLK